MALTFFEIPCGLDIQPEPGQVLLTPAPRAPRAPGSAQRSEPPLGIDAKGRTVLYDPAQAVGYREVSHDGDGERRGRVLILVRASGVLAVVTPKVEAPAVAAPEAPKRARRERPPVETQSMEAARAEAEQAAREALEAAGAASPRSSGGASE